MKVLFLAMAALANAELVPDIAFLPEHEVANMTVRSGQLLASETAQDASTMLLWDVVVTPEPGAIRTQLRFSESTLLSDNDVDAVTLKIWSEFDGSVQLLNAHTIRQWGFQSATFNGDTVHVQVLATKDAGLVDVKIIGALVGEGQHDAGYSTLCGSRDNRERSNTRQNFRYVIGGYCSGGIITIGGSDSCLMTAGHCTGTGAVHFNVPNSASNGGVRAPNAVDQYPIDSSSIQSTNSGVGNDWKHMGAFPNSNSGRTAFETQKASFPFNPNPSGPPSGNFIHNGHGSTSPRNYLNLVNKGTPNGGTWTRNGNSLRYRFDTTGGDSGSAVADSRGNYVGVHTHGGCRASNPTSGNAGTWTGRSQLLDAVRNSRGICSQEGALAAKEQHYGVHFRGDVHAHGGPKALFE